MYNWTKIISPEEKIQMEFSISNKFISLVLVGVVLLVILTAFFSFLASFFILILGIVYWIYLKKAKHYCFTLKRIILVDSFVGSSTTSIDYSQVTDIEIEQSFFEQAVGWGTLVINTAGTHVPEIRLPFVDNPQTIKAKMDEIRDSI